MTDTTAPTPVETVIAAIARVAGAQMPSTWEITVRGVTFHTGALTWAELAEVQEILAVPSWREIRPAVVDHLMALVFVYLKRTMSAADAKAECATLRGWDITAVPVVITDAMRNG